jgi:hypothetical protein
LRWLVRVWRQPASRVAAILALLSLGTFVLMLGRPSFTNASQPPRLGSAVLALQFVRDANDVDLILGEAPSPDREVMRIKTYIDFALIAFYVPLLVILGVLVARRSGWKRIAGAAASIGGVATGAFDILENRAILEILDAPLRSTTAAMLHAIRGAAMAKWALAGATILLLSTYFIRRRDESTS